jgi:hypothetical protein
LGAAVWSFAPTKSQVIEPSQAADGTHDAPPALAALDRDAFRAPLWVAPPAPPAPPVASAPPPPLKLQLLAVVHEGGERGNGGVYKAMLYDPDSDKILVAGDGETVLGKKIEKVTGSGVQIRDGANLRTLALRTDQPGSKP